MLKTHLTYPAYTKQPFCFVTFESEIKNLILDYAQNLYQNYSDNGSHPHSFKKYCRSYYEEINNLLNIEAVISLGTVVFDVRSFPSDIESRLLQVHPVTEVLSLSHNPY